MPTGGCIADTDPCPLGTVADGDTCVVPAVAAALFDFTGSLPITSTGYNTSAQLSTSSCDPIAVDGRGHYFDADSHHTLDLVNMPLYQDFTVEMWIRPTETGSGSLFSFKNNLLDFGGNLWISSCLGLVLDWGVSQQASNPNSLSTSNWSKVALTVNSIGAHNVRASIFINGYMVASENIGSAFSADASGTHKVGSFAGWTMFYDGFIYSLDYFEYVKTITVNTACTDAACPVCQDDGSCINNCDVNDFDNAGTCDECPTCDCGCNAAGDACNTCTECATDLTCDTNCANCSGTGASDCY